MRFQPTQTVISILLASVACSSTAQPFLDKLDDSLFVESKNGAARLDASVLFDLEGYYIDQRPPGLLFDDANKIVPRLSLFFDVRLGKTIFAFTQIRVDRGFDPGVAVRDSRFDEYAVRYTPFEDGRLNLQAGKFATVFGNWVQRHSSWENPFINAPLAYEGVVTVADGNVPATPGAFVARKNAPDNKGAWLPLLWGPSYASGASVFGSVDNWDYAVEIKNASISSRPAVWDWSDQNMSHPTWSGRIGYRPTTAWNLGLSASHGAYLLPSAEDTAAFPTGRDIGDFPQTTVAADASYAWRRWQFWGEAMLSRFDVPNVGDADMASYHIEAKYKFNARLFGALRWNQQFFDKVNDGAGGEAAWDNDMWRVDTALGCRFTRHLQAKLQYSYNHQRGPLQQGEQLLAAQLTLKF